MSGGLEQAFMLAAGELGMASAAWLFTEEVASSEGAAGVESLRDGLGRRWPVLDAVCAAWLEGIKAPTPDASELDLEELQRLVVVGFEARWFDALMAAVPSTLRVGLVRHSEFSPDWARVAANYRSLELLELSEFQSWAGKRSALLTFVYGSTRSEDPFALSAWARVAGPDVRTQFRSLIGWDVLRLPLPIYPRWLVRVSGEDFTQLEAGE